MSKKREGKEFGYTDCSRNARELVFDKRKLDYIGYSAVLRKSKLSRLEVSVVPP